MSKIPGLLPNSPWTPKDLSWDYAEGANQSWGREWLDVHRNLDDTWSVRPGQGSDGHDPAIFDNEDNAAAFALALQEANPKLALFLRAPEYLAPHLVEQPTRRVAGGLGL